MALVKTFGGKRALLKLISGYLRPTGGIVRVFGQNPFNSLAVSGIMIYIDASTAFPQALNLGEIISEMKRFYGGFDEAHAPLNGIVYCKT